MLTPGPAKTLITPLMDSSGENWWWLGRGSSVTQLHCRYFQNVNRNHFSSISSIRITVSRYFFGSNMLCF